MMAVVCVVALSLSPNIFTCAQHNMYVPSNLGQQFPENPAAAHWTLDAHVWLGGGTGPAGRHTLMSGGAHWSNVTSTAEFVITTPLAAKLTADVTCRIVLLHGSRTV